MAIFGVQISMWDPPLAQPVVLSGKRIAITGKLALPRAEAVHLLTACGGRYASAVSRTTDYLVVGDLHKTPSRKLTAATLPVSDKIRLLTPIEFYASLGLIE